MRNVLSVIVLIVLFYGEPLKAVENYSIQDSTKKSINKPTPFPKSKLGVDIMVLMTGEQREVEIRKFSTKYIYYSKPAESNMTQIDRRLVNAIYYRSGSKEVITPKAVDIPVTTDWEKIKVTENPKDVGPTMIEIDVIEVVVEASTREQYYKPKTLENSAIIILKKKAAMINGELVVITKISHNRPYGEAPSVRIEAIAYRRM